LCFNKLEVPWVFVDGSEGSMQQAAAGLLNPAVDVVGVDVEFTVSVRLK